MEKEPSRILSDADLFRQVTEKMAETFERKDATYGNSFAKSVGKYGMIAALTRISDKFNRIENLILGAKNNVPEESIKDTLLDLACYSVMTLIEVDKRQTSTDINGTASKL